MAQKSYVVLLQPNLPAELIGFLGGFLHQHGQSHYFFCAHIEHLHRFLEVGLTTSSLPTAWAVQIPYECVLAVADMSQGHAGPGFLTKAQ